MEPRERRETGEQDLFRLRLDQIHRRDLNWWHTSSTAPLMSRKQSSRLCAPPLWSVALTNHYPLDGQPTH